MGSTYITQIIFGIEEPDTWKEKRRKIEKTKILACPTPTHTGHGGDAFCPQCGSRREIQMAETVKFTDPVLYYGGPPSLALDPISDADYETIRENWVHVAEMFGAGKVYLGIELIQRKLRDDIGGWAIPSPPPTAVTLLEEWLTDLPYALGAKPALHLVLSVR